ncbi:MAG: hypothetical protein RL662_103, partial [Bacteroidota bacterium]
MKIDLTDVTFLILVRLDSIQRLENLVTITDRLIYYFKTNIIVREADGYNNLILKSTLNGKIQYQFVEDKDPVLHKTKHFNQLLMLANTPFVSVWDVDIIPEKNTILECMDYLRNKKADITYPYNGVCYDLSEIIRSFYLKKKDVRILYRHKSKMELLHPYALVGGAVIMNKKKYIEAGGENEKHYGWGNDDFDRYY